jgi:hypothetical protein
LNLEVIKAGVTIETRQHRSRRYPDSFYDQPSSVQTLGYLDVLVHNNVPIWNLKNINWQKDGF